MNVRILYEDNHLLVVEKPPNVPTQADESGDPDLLTVLKADVKRRHEKPGAVYLGLVHRLDRPVGGVMVFARTSKAASRLAEQVRSRTIGKTYLAVVEGSPAGGTLRHRLRKDRESNVVRVTSEADREGKEAVLRYRALECRDDLSLVRIELVTGRSHQVRVQFAATGHPLVGDRKYGHASGRSRRLALWAVALELSHPTRKERMRFVSAPPDRDPWDRFRASRDATSEATE